ncbi:MAG: tetratricopeptide repeat protein [Planctomycetes bacterium]|nr:tetratricopeptide repeat protein [Planctomycetota bacterium]
MPSEPIGPIDLRGKRIALTGRFAAMTHDALADWIEARGGEVVRVPSRSTDIVVVGQDGLPLHRDGAPTESLSKAQSLRERGYPLVVVGEQQFLEAVAAGEGDEETTERQGLYTAIQLGRFLDLPASTLRSWVRRGLLQPARSVDRVDYFSFQQVSAIKMLRELMRRGLSSAAVARSLRKIEEWLPESTASLAELGLVERDGELFVELDDGVLADSSGQLALFGDADPPEEPPRPVAVESGESRAPVAAIADLEQYRRLQQGDDARQWFDHAVDLEEAGDLGGAIEAYRRAQRHDPDDAEIAFNLGNALYEGSDRHGARAEFERAIDLDPDYVEAWNNLGSLYMEEERYPQAIAAYRNALEIAPDYPDANYNLAEALLAVGETAEASRHALRYFRHDPTSSWAQRLRDEIATASAG